MSALGLGWPPSQPVLHWKGHEESCGIWQMGNWYLHFSRNKETINDMGLYFYYLKELALMESRLLSSENLWALSQDLAGTLFVYSCFVSHAKVIFFWLDMVQGLLLGCLVDMQDRMCLSALHYYNKVPKSMLVLKKSLNGPCYGGSSSHPLSCLTHYMKTQMKLVDDSGKDWSLTWSYPKPENREVWGAPNVCYSRVP